VYVFYVTKAIVNASQSLCHDKALYKSMFTFTSTSPAISVQFSSTFLYFIFLLNKYNDDDDNDDDDDTSFRYHLKCLITANNVPFKT